MKKALKPPNIPNIHTFFFQCIHGEWKNKISGGKQISSASIAFQSSYLRISYSAIHTILHAKNNKIHASHLMISNCLPVDNFKIGNI